ncbi:MAG: hypothetical protein PHI31_02530 [Desulfuromonadaceae bacterium]|nr:hypothetical protein [Desulfuromonadaceae bacterium]
MKLLHVSLLMLCMSAMLTGCLAVHPPLSLQYINGVSVESLTSGVSLSYASSDRSISGSGYLMYRKPDQIRAVILSPFGSVLQEVYVSGDNITIVDAGNGIAFLGTITDMPASGDFSGWRHIHWLIDIDTPDSLRGTAVIERVNRFGDLEKVTFENGLVVSKSTARGGTVAYGKYTVVQGIAFPLEIIYKAASQETFIIRFDEPEMNTTFVDGAFTPNVRNLRQYPLSSLK